MKRVWDILKKRPEFLVKTVRRKFADRIGIVFGVIGIFITIAGVACGLFGGGFECIVGFIPFIPFILLIDLIGIELNNEFLHSIAYILGAFFIYYIIGYLFGLLLFFLGEVLDFLGKN